MTHISYLLELRIPRPLYNRKHDLPIAGDPVTLEQLTQAIQVGVTTSLRTYLDGNLVVPIAHVTAAEERLSP